VATSTDGDTVYDGRSFYEGGSTELGETELIREVRFPALGPDEGAAYEKWKPAGCAWPVATVGAYLSTSGGTVEEARLYTGALEGEPREMADSAGVIEGEPPEERAVLDAATRLGEDAEPMADADGSVEFKRELSKKLAKDALEAAASRAGV
jgi:carbon-monoxide dehydrogenase medium subunit